MVGCTSSIGKGGNSLEGVQHRVQQGGSTQLELQVAELLPKAASCVNVDLPEVEAEHLGVGVQEGLAEEGPIRTLKP